MHFEATQPGIRTRHEFSAGAHYDADNVSFGPVVGLDEHVVDAGAGFGWHAHRGVHLVSWVLEGTLRHEDSSGQVRLVEAGSMLVQSAGAGIRHTETNACDVERLRFVQLTVLGDGAPRVRYARPPLSVGGVTVSPARGPVGPVTARTLVYDPASNRVARLEPGGSIAAAGELLVVRLGS